MSLIEDNSHLDPGSEINLETVKNRAVKGIVVLTGGSFVLSTISLIATGLLTVFLSPSEFGIFWIVSAVVNFLAYFSDIGLAAALIQKREKITNTDLKTSFSIQQGLVLSILVVLFALTPTIARAYSLSSEGIMLLYALGISLLLSSLKTIPSALLERGLKFDMQLIPRILEALAFNIVVVILAWKGYGIAAFTYAVLARGFVGLISIYIIKPWLPGFAMAKASLKKLLPFGLPYQANTLLATLKDDGMTAVLGTILGPQGIGYLGWAQKWGQLPLRFFMDQVIKVTFPAFARMQDDMDHLKSTVTRSIFFICFGVFPSLIGILILAPILIDIIPRYEKWLPALVPLFFICINSAFAASTTQLTNLLNSIGRIKTTFKLMIMWTVLTWILVPFLAIKFGVNGAALGYALVGSSSVVAIYIARRYVSFSLMEAVFKPGVAAIAMGIVLFIIRKPLPVSMASIAILVGSGIAIYLGVGYLLYGRTVIADAKKIITTVLPNKRK